MIVKRNTENGEPVLQGGAAKAMSTIESTPVATPVKAVTYPDSSLPEENPVEFLNRELQWLQFNRRVLNEAMDERTPLLERVGFLGIFTSNLDEFFMKRVGGLKRQSAARISAISSDGQTATQQLAAIRAAVVPMLNDQARAYLEQIRPAMAQHGVHLMRWQDLSDAERSFAEDYFLRHVYPVLTPMAVDPGHPFPFISNLSLSLGVKLAHPRYEEQLFARVKVPDVLQRWFRVEGDAPTGQVRFVSLLDTIAHHLHMLFPGMQVLSVMPFRVTRNADVERDEEDVEDLLELVEQELRERRFQRIVRLEHGPEADPSIVQFLMRELEITEQDVYELPAELDYKDLRPVADLQISNLRYVPWSPVVPARLAASNADIFSVIRNADLMVHHPYEDFSESVERFIKTAAADPKVFALKITLYRVGDSRLLMNSLIQAAEAGKQVVCLVELKARFDEQRNIAWAHQLERAGVHVVYGVVGLKTHTKLAIAVRQEPEGLRTYVHVGTGNYNVQTARLYTDVGLFTCREDITREIIEVFNYLTGRSLKSNYERLMVAPVNMRQRLVELIENERRNALEGKPARIVAKMNSMEDRHIIRTLYAASQAGVQVDLIVRGFCCLRPGVPGMSENIRVMSIVGRFLEHTRLFYFRDGAEQELDGKFYIGSADWMYRNLSSRVEVVAPVNDLACRQRLWQILNVQLSDQRQAWDMQPDGGYIQRKPDDPNTPGAQALLMQLARDLYNLELGVVATSDGLR